MKLLRNSKILSISILVAVGLAACDNKPAGNAGDNSSQTSDNNTVQRSEQAIDNMGDRASQTANNIGDSMERQGEKTGQALDDAAITTKVKAAIFAEPSLKTLQISVDTIQGVVSLTGSVDSQADSNKAKALASSVEGVKVVENRLALK